MAIPIRFAPVLTGNDAVEFYERWHETMKSPDPTYPSEDRLKELEKSVKKHIIDGLNKGL